MKVSVWDTYVKRSNGTVMHFDILVPSKENDKSKVFQFGKDFLSSKPYKTGSLSSQECVFCHIEEATQSIIDEILQKGYYIIEMENCQ